MIRALDPDEFVFASRCVLARAEGRTPCGSASGSWSVELLVNVLAEINWNGDDAHVFLERFVALTELALQPAADDRILMHGNGADCALSIPAFQRAATFPLYSADIGFDAEAFLLNMG